MIAWLRWRRRLRRARRSFVPIKLEGLGDGELTVSVEVGNRWIPVIHECYIEGGMISHIVEPLGIETALERARGAESSVCPDCGTRHQTAAEVFECFSRGTVTR